MKTGRYSGQWRGEALRAWRERRGYTAEHCASLLRVSPATYYRYESQPAPPDFAMINRIVCIARGAIRYGDLLPEFQPRYA